MKVARKIDRRVLEGMAHTSQQQEYKGSPSHHNMGSMVS
jgi:hypothetical protein